MRLLPRIGRILFSIYGFAVFLLLFFLLLPLFLIAFLPGGRTTGNAVISLARLWSALFFGLTFIRPRIIYSDVPQTHVEYVFVSNHISYIDIPMMLVAIKDRKVRILGKASMNKIPLFGQVYKRGAVTVDRSSSQARAKSMREMVRLVEGGVSVLVCPEGTFNMSCRPLKEFYNGAFKIAIETQRDIVPILFPDTYHRLHYRSIFSLTPGICRAVYLPKISVKGFTLEEMEKLKEQTFEAMSQGLIRLDAPWIKKETHGG